MYVRFTSRRRNKKLPNTPKIFDAELSLGLLRHGEVGNRIKMNNLRVVLMPTRVGAMNNERVRRFPVIFRKKYRMTK